MEYNRKQYLSDNTDPTVKGLTIIETDSTEGYRIAEKWNRSDGSTWVTYWIPAETLEQRATEGKVEPVGELSDKQFEQVCKLSDERALKSEASKVPA